MTNDDLSARRLARFGLRLGAYDGANRRRFVLFTNNYDGTVSRREFDTKTERNDRARTMMLGRQSLARNQRDMR